MKQIQIVTIILSACLLAACSAKVDNRGYVASEDIKTTIVKGTTTKDEIIEKLGSPSAQSTFGEETWYYISSRKEATAFLKAEVVKQDVIRITFDQSDVVSSIETFDENNRKDFDIAKRATPTEGHKLGFIEQILGNVGRFNKSDDAGVAPGRKRR